MKFIAGEIHIRNDSGSIQEVQPAHLGKVVSIVEM